MLLLGIDPGVSGAFALYDSDERTVTITDMPDTTSGLVDLVASLPVLRICTIEKPYYPKAIGVANVAKIATAYGKVIALLHQRGIPINEVRPADWKASLNLGSSKSASRELASQLFPDAAHQWARVKDDGRAEASLIAWYGLRFAKGAAA